MHLRPFASIFEEAFSIFSFLHITALRVYLRCFQALHRQVQLSFSVDGVLIRASCPRPRRSCICMIAVSDAILLSRIAKKVIIVHRRDTLRATKIYHDQLMKTENIEFRWNNTVNELIYGERLTGVRLKDTVTGEENIIECDGLFVSIGRKPTTDFLDNQIELDNKGYIVAGENTETSIPGVYAVGDVRTKLLRQIVTAVADGAMAVHMAEEYMEK